jgi:hypothetical protein
MTAMRYLVCFVILALMLAAVSCSNANPGVVSHKGFIGLREFSVTSESTGLETYAKGTVYVRENEGKNKGYHAEILAWYEVDPADFWGGVRFLIPCGWEVTGVTSNLHNVNQIWVRNMSCGNNSEWSQWVWVEHSGSGTLVIELDSTSNAQSPWLGVLRVNIGVGSDERDGIQIIFPDWQEIEIPLN